MRAKRVFCSHRGVDKPAVEDFAERLLAAGIDAWLDKWEITPGDNIVARMEEGLRECDVALIFFSKAYDPQRPDEGKWFHAEVQSLMHRRIEAGCRVIPVMLEPDVQLPVFLKPLARRGIEEFEAIVAAIEGRSAKPALGPRRGAPTATRFVIELTSSAAQSLDLVARRDDMEVARALGVRIKPALKGNFARFLHGDIAGVTRGPREAHIASLESELVALGRELGSVFFADAIGEALSSALAATGVGSQLEVIFEAADPELLALPFEAVRLADGSLLALHPSVVILRRVKGAAAPIGSAPAGPLKILVAVGAPDETHARSAVLDLERELQLILDAVDSATQYDNAAVRILEVGHPEEIRRALAEDQYHVLHLSCHGSPGALELEDEEGRPVSVSARELAAKLRESGRGLPLVFLSACHGGSLDGENIGFAQTLVREGVPLVLAMQTRVTDRYASELARAFYAELIKPDTPLASRALAQARRALEAQRQRERANDPACTAPPEYATASLFCAGSETPLLDHALDREPLRRAPVHYWVDSPVPELKLGELIGRRSELRRTLKILRADEASIAQIGERAGVVLHGIGGVGKSTLAGRVMARLAEDGWICAAISGKFNIDILARACGDALKRSPRGDLSPELARLANQLGDPQAEDQQRLSALVRLLQSQPILMVLDNFESNLEIGGAAYLDPTVGDWLRLLCEQARRGRLLLTSRYPPPDSGDWNSRDWLEPIQLGPLSPAQTRKLILRLPGLHGLEADELREIQRRIGGHPRMLEYLDAILRRGRARLPRIAQRLRQEAERTGVSLQAETRRLDEAIQKALLVGAHDVLLSELATLAREAGDEQVLLQAAVSNLPIECSGVAHALAQREPTAEEVGRARKSLERLAELSLVTFLAPDVVFVHRWTAECLLGWVPDEARKQFFRCAGLWRLRHAQAMTHAFEDAMEAVDNLIEDWMEAVDNLIQAREFDQASKIARVIADVLVERRQSAAAAGFVAGVLQGLPTDHPSYALLGDIEASSLLALGFTDRALARRQQLLGTHLARAQAEPERADYQRDLSVSYERLGDLMGALGQGEAARRYYEDSLAIGQRLVQAEPERADYQRDLVVSLTKIAAVDLNRSEACLQQALAILRGLKSDGRKVPNLDALILHCEQALGLK